MVESFSSNGKEVGEIKSSLMFSVVICTHNRASMLAEALRTVTGQTVPADQYEIVVIDNNSHDTTRQVVSRAASEFPNVRYVLEEKIGVSHARNRGWQEARGRWIAYTDDDCEVPSHWLETAAQLASTHGLGAFGGPIRCLHKGSPPRWFRDSYGSHEPFGEACFIPSRRIGTLREGNLFIRRDLVERLGGFDPMLGMTGTQIGFGEGPALLARMIKATDERAYYDPRLYVRHLVRPEKLRMSFHVRGAIGAGRSEYRMQAVQHPLSRFQLLRSSVHLFFDLCVDVSRGLLLRNRQEYPYLQNYFYERTLGYFRKFGRFYEGFRSGRVSEPLKSTGREAGSL